MPLDDDTKVTFIKPEVDMRWMKAFTLTEAEVEKLVDPEWIYEDLIIKSHLIAFPAAPGAGKTTIMMHVAAEIARAGKYKVCYVNADVGNGDVKEMQHMANEAGFTLLLPDMKAGLSMDDVVCQLLLMNTVDEDYGEYLFFFDTLKKMTDVIVKSKSKELYMTLRGLTAKGMTICLNAHTNKYADIDGKPIYEGTGDLRSDVDDMIYLIPKKNEDGTMTVSTDPDKRRGNHQPITFEISADRQVTRSGYIDTAAQVAAELRLEKDATVIESVTEAIRSGEFRQTGIVDYCREQHHIGRPSCEAVLKRYLNKLWTRKRGFENNVWIYELS